MAKKSCQPFVILTYPRSGSTWLVSLLNQVDGITSYGELFLPRKRAPGDIRWDADFAHARFVETDQVMTKFRPLGVFSFLNELYSQPGAIGFKLMSSQMQIFPELLLYFMVHHFRVVHLIRQNTLDQIISQAVKEKLDHAHRFTNQKAVEKVQVELDPKTLVNNIREKQQSTRKVDRLLRLIGLPTMKVFYEDLKGGPGAFQSICSFLSVPFVNKMPESKFVKIRQESHAKVLTNYADVCKALEGTPFFTFVEKG